MIDQWVEMVESYILTSKCIKISAGLLGKDLENYELLRSQDMNVSQHLGERMLNLGDIHITRADPPTPQIVLRNMPNPKAVFEILRKARLASCRKYGLLFSEEM